MVHRLRCFLLAFCAGVVLLGAGFIFLHRLGASPLNLWDESRVAVNAVWILRTNDWVVMRADAAPDAPRDSLLRAWQPAPARKQRQPVGVALGLVPRPVAAPDVWNTKPPLLPWLQALGLRALGYSAWAVRLPSAVAGWLTVGLLVLFGWRVLRQPALGLVAAAVLATIPAYAGYHVVRNGDYDALLVLFVTGYSLGFWTYLQNRKLPYLLATAASLALALLAKCSAALLAWPSLLAYVLLTPRHRWVLREGRAVLALLAAFVPLLLYYAWREHAAAGYLAATWYNDWAGRFGQQVSGVDLDRWIYLRRLLTSDRNRTDDLFVWLPGLLISTVAVLVRGRALPEITRYAAGQAAGVLLLLTLARTRFPWYSAQVYPMLALVIAGGWYALWRWLARRSRWAGYAAVGLVLLLAIGAATAVLRRNGRTATGMASPGRDYGAAFRQLAKSISAPQVVMLRDNFNSTLDFYMLTVPPLPRSELRVREFSPTNVNALRVGQTVLVCSTQHLAALAQRFSLQPVAEAAPCTCVQLGQK